MAKTHRVTLYGNLYPGWQNSMFPPSLHSMPPGTWPGAVPVAVEIDLPVIEPDAGTYEGRVLQGADPVQFPAKKAS